MVQIQASSNRGMLPYGGGVEGLVEGLMGSRWTESADTAVRLAAALDWEHGGRRLVDLAERLGRTEGAVQQRACRLRALQLEGDVDGGRPAEPPRRSAPPPPDFIGRNGS